MKKKVYSYGDDYQVTISDFPVYPRSLLRPFYERERLTTGWGKWKYKGMAKIKVIDGQFFLTHLERGLQDVLLTLVEDEK